MAHAIQRMVERMGPFVEGNETGKGVINVKRVRFIDGVESSRMRKIRTYAEVTKMRRNQ